jgi:nitrogenase molybdenum-iron protein alpha/beta subunit
MLTSEQIRRSAAAGVRKELKWMRAYARRHGVPGAVEHLKEIDKAFTRALEQTRRRGQEDSHDAAA